MLKGFMLPGKASFITGGQWGSESKGAAAAWAALQIQQQAARRSSAHPITFDIVTCNNGVQSGHTSVHQGVKRVAYHLPTAPLVSPGSAVYLNGGAVIDPKVLQDELSLAPNLHKSGFFIHPNAAVITPECRDAENRPDSAQTKIASTRKGVGEALARKVLRSGEIARDHPYLRQFVRRIDLNERLNSGASVLVEVPQGHGLSIDESFYPHCTSRNCTVGQAMSDAGIHPSFVGPIMLVLRTFPIRVGNIPVTPEWDREMTAASKPNRMLYDGQVGYSGGHYPDQEELTWDQLGVEPEITTVTKRVRRVFTFSEEQLYRSMGSARPTHVFLSHCDYVAKKPIEHRTVGWYVDCIKAAARSFDLPAPQIACSYGPTTGDVQVWGT